DETFVQDQPASVEPVGDPAPGLFRAVTRDHAAIKRQGAFIIYATATSQGIGIAIGDTIAHSHAGDGDQSRGDIEDAKLRRAAGSTSLDSQLAGPWSRNRQVLVDNQLTGGQGNGAQAGSEINRVAGRSAGNGSTQRSGAVVARVRDCDCAYGPGSHRQQG